jgi:hypothetical protein
MRLQLFPHLLYFIAMAIFGVGDLITLDGLQSETGKKLNGKTAVVRAAAPEGRLEVKVENVKGTIAAKPANIKIKSKLPLPGKQDSQRGIVMTQTGGARAQKLVETLVRHDNGYHPSDVMFMGEASSRFMQLGQFNFMCFVAYQMEQLGGMCGLTAMSLEGEAEQVMFALLKADTMCLDVILLMIYQTPLILPEDDIEKHPNQNTFTSYSTDSFTPDQDGPAYIQSMISGPIGLLEQLAEYTHGDAFFGAIRNTRFWHFLVRRLLRIMAREAQRTKDGIKLGKKIRTVFAALCKNDLNPKILEALRIGPVNTLVAETILENEKALDSPGTVKSNLNAIFEYAA